MQLSLSALHLLYTQQPIARARIQTSGNKRHGWIITSVPLVWNCCISSKCWISVCCVLIVLANWPTCQTFVPPPCRYSEFLFSLHTVSVSQSASRWSRYTSAALFHTASSSPLQARSCRLKHTKACADWLRFPLHFEAPGRHCGWKTYSIDFICSCFVFVRDYFPSVSCYCKISSKRWLINW